MGLLSKGSDTQYLLDYKHGRIEQGLGINCELDNNLRFKRGQYCGVLGGNNVGKTFFMTWYFACLASIHDLKFGLWMDENKKGKAMRDLVQFYTGEKLGDLSDEMIVKVSEDIEDNFYFIDNSKLYKPEDLFKLFESQPTDAVLLDPFNQLNRPIGYSENIPFIRNIKHWCKTKDITLYLTMHPNTETGRKSYTYPDTHEWAGQPMMPLKHNSEGGSVFSNMADDWINLHRLNKLESMKYITMLDIDKVKDIDTGGSITNSDDYLFFHFNGGKGFLINGVNPLQGKQDSYRSSKSLNEYVNNLF
mgnify:CR=1 FL=1